MSKFIDIVGDTYGRLTVIERIGNTNTYLCRCICGNYCKVVKNYLRNKKTTSCGCYRDEFRRRVRVDYTGQTFGKLTAIERFTEKKDNRSRTYWRCSCSCGNETIVCQDSLLTKNGTKSCGCLQKEIASKVQFEDLSGEKFTRLLVLHRVENIGERVRYACLCDCGKEVIVNSSNLRSKSTKSCGCLNDESRGKYQFIDITGDKYGRLLVIEQCGRSKNGDILWRTLCDCGAEKITISDSLRSGAVTSCGCYRKEESAKRLTTHGLSKTPEFLRMLWRKRRDLEELLDSDWTYEMELLIHETFDSCVVCGRTDYLTVDHVLPLSKGYGLKPGNAVILCRSCNSSKSNKDLSSLPQDVQSKILTAAALFKEVWDNYVPEVYEDDTEDNDWEG